MIESAAQNAEAHEYYDQQEYSFLATCTSINLDDYLGNIRGGIDYGKQDLSPSLSDEIVSLTDQMLCLAVTETMPREQRSRAIAAVADAKKWVIDSGCSTTLCCQRSWFKGKFQAARIPIKIANGKYVYAEGYGSIKIPVITKSSKRTHLLIQRALYVPTCPTNLLSVSQLTDANHTVVLDNKDPRVEIAGSDSIVALTRENRTWCLNTAPPLSASVPGQ